MSRCDAYADHKKFHNLHCVSWIEGEKAQRETKWERFVGTETGNQQKESQEILCRYVSEDDVTRPGLLDRKRWTCEGHPEFDIAVMHENCTVWWHRQAHNALPLPLMTTFVLNEMKNHQTSICLVDNDDDDIVRAGRLIGSTERYAACEYAVRGGKSLRERSGDYLLLGSFDRSDPYSSDVASGFEAENDREEEALRRFLVKELDRLVKLYLTEDDRHVLENATGTTADALIDALRSASARLLHRFFSEDRFVFEPKLNKMGMHVLRSILAERVVDAMRAAKSYDVHPDYAAFLRDGVLMKDFSSMTNEDLVELLQMVSGYDRDMIPPIAWELRPVYHQNSSHDLNQDLHVDTYHASIKVWLYAENVTSDKGPFTVVRGSHRVGLAKAKFLYAVSTNLTERGPQSYGSFRLIEGADETTYGFSQREGLVGEAMTLLIADTVALHARGVSVPGAVRRTFVLRGKNNDGGLRRRNPFLLARESLDVDSKTHSSCESDDEIARHAPLTVYRSDEAVDVLHRGLEKNYAEVDVRAVPCPDLRLWGQAARGLSGSPRLCEVGGEHFMHNPKYNGRSSSGDGPITFSIDSIAAAVDLPDFAFVLGAGGACNEALRGHGGELQHSAVVPKLRGAVLSKAMRVDEHGDFVLEHYNDLRNGGLGNLFLSEGKPGVVLRVEVKRRVGEIGSFTQALREALRMHLKDDGGDESSRQTGLGGVFQILDGAVKTHVQPDWNAMPAGYFDVESSRAVKSFLHFFETVHASASRPLICASTLWTGDPTGGDLHLRASGDHTHCHNEDGSGGGHYHYDVAPESAHYLGYFVMPEAI
eukprot:g206.t1